MTCAFEPTNRRLVASGGLDNTCSIYSIGSASEVVRPSKELTGHEGYLSCCRFTDEEHVITSSGDSTCAFWDVPTCTMVSRFTEHGGDVMGVSFPTSNSNLFASASCDTTCKIWDIRSGVDSVTTFRGHESDVNSVDFLSNGCTISSGWLLYGFD